MEVHVLLKESETGKNFKITPKRYISRYNRLTLIRDEYKIYCEPIELNFDQISDCDTCLLVEYFNQEVSNMIYSKILRWVQ